METTNGQVRLTGYVSEEDHRRLRVLAAERGVRVTVLLREMVARGLDDAQAEHDAGTDRHRG